MAHSFENTFFIFLNVLIWILSKKSVETTFENRAERVRTASPDIVAI